MKKLGGGFLYDVKKGENDDVIKVARNNSTSLGHEQNSLARHRDFLGEYVAEGEFYMPKDGSLESHQEFIDGSPVDLQKEFYRKDIQDILERGKGMQDTTGFLFDLFGLKGLVNIFNYYHNGPFGQISSLALPLNAMLLEKIYNFPKELLHTMNNDTESSPFIAYNLLRNSDNELVFIDTDSRPLDAMHPLNILGRVYTQKILDELHDSGTDQRTT